jgi:hypothetical protein
VRLPNVRLGAARRRRKTGRRDRSGRRGRRRMGGVQPRRADAGQRQRRYREAERLLEQAESRNEPDPRAPWYLEMAKLHTALAAVAATALNSHGREWIEVAGRRSAVRKAGLHGPPTQASRSAERHHATPASTDSRQRRFLPKFLPKETAQRSSDTVYAGHGSKKSSLLESVTSLPSWSCGFDSRRPLHKGCAS